MLPEQQVEAQRGETKELLKVDLRMELKEELKLQQESLPKDKAQQQVNLRQTNLPPCPPGQQPALAVYKLNQ